MISLLWTITAAVDDQKTITAAAGVATSNPHREGFHSLPSEDYIVYTHTFSGGPEPDLFSRPNVRKIPRKKTIVKRFICICSMDSGYISEICDRLKDVRDETLRLSL
jgi:hypothetical protein